MKRVDLISLFVASVYLTQAQNSPANHFAPISILPEIKLSMAELPPILSAEPVMLRPASYYIGEKYKGLWISHYSNGNRCDSGFLNESMPDGLWKSWYPNGQLRMEIECSARRLNATKDEMHRLYKPGYSPNKNTKAMRQLLTNSHPYEKLMYRQLFLATHPEEIEKNNEAVQVQVTAGESSNSFTTNSPPFTECLVHGLFKTWFENGALKDSGYCDNGIREGVWQEWDQDMQMRAVGFYKSGLRWKDWRYYNKEGKLEYIKWYNRAAEITETIVLK